MKKKRQPLPRTQDSPESRQALRTRKRRRRPSVVKMLRNHELEENVVEIEVEPEEGFCQRA